MDNIINPKREFAAAIPDVVQAPGIVVPNVTAPVQAPNGGAVSWNPGAQDRTPYNNVAPADHSPEVSKFETIAATWRDSRLASAIFDYDPQYYTPDPNFKPLESAKTWEKVHGTTLSPDEDKIVLGATSAADYNHRIQRIMDQRTRGSAMAANPGTAMAASFASPEMAILIAASGGAAALGKVAGMTTTAGRVLASSAGTGAVDLTLTAASENNRRVTTDSDYAFSIASTAFGGLLEFGIGAKALKMHTKRLATAERATVAEAAPQAPGAMQAMPESTAGIVQGINPDTAAPTITLKPGTIENAYARVEAAAANKTAALEAGSITQAIEEELIGANKEYHDLLTGQYIRNEAEGTAKGFDKQATFASKKALAAEDAFQETGDLNAQGAALRMRQEEAKFVTMAKQIREHTESVEFDAHIAEQRNHASTLAGYHEGIAMMSETTATALKERALIANMAGRTEQAAAGKGWAKPETTTGKLGQWYGDLTAVRSVSDELENMFGSGVARTLLGKSAESDYSGAFQTTALHMSQGKVSLNAFDDAVGKIVGKRPMFSAKAWEARRLAVESETQMLLGMKWQHTVKNGLDEAAFSAQGFSQEAQDLAKAYEGVGFNTSRLKSMKQYRVAGAAEVESSTAYVPQRIHFERLRALERNGTMSRSGIYSFLGKLMVNANPEIVEGAAGFKYAGKVATPEQYIGKKFYEQLAGAKPGDSVNLTEVAIAQLSKQLQVSTETIAKAVGDVKGETLGAASRSYTRERIAFDWNLMDDSGKVSLKDIIDPDMSTTLQHYNAKTAGDIGMAKVGMFDEASFDAWADALIMEGNAANVAKGMANPASVAEQREMLRVAKDIVYHRGLGAAQGPILSMLTALGGAIMLKFSGLWGAGEAANLVAFHGASDTAAAVAKALRPAIMGMTPQEGTTLYKFITTNANAGRKLRNVLSARSDNHFGQNVGLEGWFAHKQQYVQNLNLGNQAQKLMHNAYANIAVDHIEALGDATHVNHAKSTDYIKYLVESSHGVGTKDSDTVFQAFKRNAEKHGAFTDKWDVQSDEQLKVMLLAEMDNTVIATSAADMPRFMSDSAAAKVLVPFQTFLANTYGKITRRAYHMNGSTGVAKLLVTQAALTAMIMGTKNVIQGKPFEEKIVLGTAMQVSAFGLPSAMAGMGAQMLFPETAGNFSPGAAAYAGPKSIASAMRSLGAVASGDAEPGDALNAVTKLPYASVFWGTNLAMAALRDPEPPKKERK